jgi:hypothetical protein
MTTIRPVTARHTTAVSVDGIRDAVWVYVPSGGEEPLMTTDVKAARRRRLDSEKGLLLMVAILVLLGATAVMTVSGW